MTAVATPLTSDSRLGWGMSSARAIEDMMLAPPRKTVQRSNSSSSIASNSSTSSSASTISASSAQTNSASGTPSSDAASWTARKKPSRGLWPPGKAEPATGLTTARPQAVTSAASGSTTSSAGSAMGAPVLPSPRMANGTSQANGSARNSAPLSELSAILHLLPMNGTFERKTITVPCYPDVLRIGRQTNQKTLPTPLNGYFDSKVLSRQHAEVWADGQGHIFIRDVKSSNGTFVNGVRLSQENKESEPRELREQDLLELGIDIVSEDQKTVVHHKVAAKVEHAGVYGQGSDGLNFSELDPNAAGGLMAGPHSMKRNGGPGSVNGRSPAVTQGMTQAAMNLGAMNQPPIRNYLNPITPEYLVKRLNTEMKFAMQQSQDLRRAKQAIETMLGNKLESPIGGDEIKMGSGRSRPSPIKSKGDLRAHFTDPPAPPPQAPLPEKPDMARVLMDAVNAPQLRRNNTARPPSMSSSPTRPDYSGEILRLCEELKSAKSELSHQSERMKDLEGELVQERIARETAEERAQRFERRGSLRGNSSTDVITTDERAIGSQGPAPHLQVQLDRLQISLDDMKQQMEAYRQRAEIAEQDRDEARQSLSEIIERKRRENAENGRIYSPSRTSRSPQGSTPKLDSSLMKHNGHAVSPLPASPTSDTLLERAGVEEGQPITPEQAKIITQFLTEEVLGSRLVTGENFAHYGRPYGSAAAVVIFGFLVMTWVNGWPKVER